MITLKEKDADFIANKIRELIIITEKFKNEQSELILDELNTLKKTFATLPLNKQKQYFNFLASKENEILKLKKEAELNYQKDFEQYCKAIELLVKGSL